MNKKKICFIVIIGIIIILSLFIIYFYSTELLQNNYVFDELQLFSPSTTQHLSKINNKLKKTIEIQVYTVNLEGESSTSITSSLFKQALADGLNKDNGMIIVISKNTEQKKYYIDAKVGQELGKILPQKRINELISKNITPHLKNMDFDTAITSGATIFHKVISKEYGGYYIEGQSNTFKIKDNFVKVILTIFVSLILIIGVLLNIHYLSGHDTYEETFVEIKKEIDNLLKKWINVMKDSR